MAEKKQKPSQNSGELRTLASDLKRLEGKNGGEGNKPQASSNSSGLSGNIMEDEEDEQLQAGAAAPKAEDVKAKKDSGINPVSEKKKAKKEKKDPIDDLDPEEIKPTSKKKTGGKKGKDVKDTELSLLDDEDVDETSSSMKGAPKDEDPLKDLENARKKDDKEDENVQQGVAFESEEEANPFYKTGWFIGTLAVLVLLAIGGGTFFYLNSSSDSSQTATTQPEESSSNGASEGSSSSESEPSESQPQVDGNQIVATGEVVQVSMSEGDNIRRAILDSLSEVDSQWVEIVLTQDRSRVSFSDELVSAMGITVYGPLQDSVNEYQLLAYNQEGVYKLGMILETSSSNAETLVEEWSANIPFDMSQFALETSSRTVVDPQINTRTISANGQDVTNYYYNYTDELNSIDVAGAQNMVMVSTSKTAQGNLIPQALQNASNVDN